MAQVYSVNAVGYVNLTPAVGPGYTMIGNPLIGTNNHLNTIMPLPDTADGTSIYRFNAAAQNYYETIIFYAGYGWFTTDPDANAMVIAPGEGFFIQPPAGVTLNLTFVGEVPQAVGGTPLSIPVAGTGRYALLASQVPQALPLGKAADAENVSLRFPAADGDSIYMFDAAAQAYKETYIYYDGYGWYSTNPDDPGVNGPVIPVATGFFSQKGSANPQVPWTRNFTVN